MRARKDLVRVGRLNWIKPHNWPCKPLGESSLFVKIKSRGKQSLSTENPVKTSLKSISFSLLKYSTAAAKGFPGAKRCDELHMGGEPPVAAHVPQRGASRRRDDGSAQLDFVLTYSIHHWMRHLSAVAQNKLTSTLPNGEGDLPFTRAATAS